MKYTNQYFQDLEAMQNSIPSIGELHNKQILITGANGLIGSTTVDFLMHLNDTLACNNHIYIGARDEAKIRKRFGEKLERKDVSFVYYDALQPLTLDADINYIIHSASPANPAMYIENPVETMLINFVGLNHILEYARDNRIDRVLFISSSEVYGKRSQSSSPYSEEDFGYVDLLNPRACYPSVKRSAETLCAAYLKEYGVNTVIVRPGHIYGAAVTDADNKASSQFLKDVAKGRDLIMKSAGTQLRSYCHVCDCVSSIFTVLLNGKDGSAYNISNPNSICTIREMAECIAKTGGQKLLFETPSIQEQNSYNLMDNSSLDSSMLEELGWKGLFDLETGISHALEMMD